MSWLTQLPHKDSDTLMVCHKSDGVRSLTKKEFTEQVTRLLPTLAEFDAQGVAYQLDNTPAWCVLEAALSELKRVAIPLPTFFTAQQIAFGLQNSGAGLFVCDRAYEGEHARLVALVDVCKHYPLYVYQLTNTQPVPYFANTQKITFTSGSTGTPKGVCLSLESQLQVATSLYQSIGLEKPNHLCLLPLPVLLENLAGVYAPLLAGGTVNLVPLAELGFSGAQLLEPHKLIAAIERTEPNTLILVPELLTCLVAFAKQGWQAPKSLKFIAVGGAVVSQALIKQAREFGLPVYQGYGLSESSSVVSLNTRDDDDIDTAGRVLKHIQYKIENGQLYIKGSLFLGYLGQAAQSADDWYATGDLVTEQAGRLVIQGRLKNQLITSFGRNISAEWPESLLLSHSQVQQAVVIGEGQAFLAALIYANQAMSDDELAAHITAQNAQLPEYAQIKKWHRMAEPMSHTQGLLTSNNRPKRDVINQFFATEISALYQEATSMNQFFNTLQAETQKERDYLLAAPIISRVFKGEVSLSEYASFLTQAYHHVKHTVPLLMAVGAKLSDKQEWLREAVAEYIEEELGHQEWVLNDIAACGFDKELVRHSRPQFSTELMVSYAYDTINRGNPLAFFGMVHVLEGTSIALADNAAGQIREVVGLPKKAFTYLTSHGALDIEHVKFFENLMNKIDNEDDQQAIIHAAKCFYKLYGNIFRDLDSEPFFSEADLEQSA